MYAISKYTDYEMIFIDDCSSDDSFDKIKNLCKDNKSVIKHLLCKLVFSGQWSVVSIMWEEK